MLSKIHRRYISLAKKALLPNQANKDSADYVVSSDFYRVDIGLLISRPPLHLRMQPIEWENMKLEYELAVKHKRMIEVDPIMFEFPFQLPTEILDEDNLRSTHYQIMEGQKLQELQQENKLRKEIYDNYKKSLPNKTNKGQ